MALNPGPVGTAIAAFIQSTRPTEGDPPVTEGQLEAMWQGVMTIIYNDLKANLGVIAGGFQVTGVQPGLATIAVSGVGGPAQ